VDDDVEAMTRHPLDDAVQHGSRGVRQPAPARGCLMMRKPPGGRADVGRHEALVSDAAREGAVILGRTTFDVSVDAWGGEPPICKPCFVLTHGPERAFVRRGDTTFTFVTDPRDALDRARRAAAGRDVGVMGGAMTIRAYFSAGLLDELHLHLLPVVLGRGVRLFEGIDRDVVGFRRMRVRSGEKAPHLQYRLDAGRISADAQGLGRCLGT
jgi:dihydrofolate reductase